MAQERNRSTKHDKGPNVSLRGQIESTELRDVTAKGVSLVVRLKLEFRNNGPKPIIFLNEPAPALTGATLNREVSDTPRNALVTDYRGPSVDTSAKWLTLRDSLDKAVPPSDLVRILQPGELWWFDRTLDIALPTEAGKTDYIPRRASWETIVT